MSDELTESSTTSIEKQKQVGPDKTILNEINSLLNKCSTPYTPRHAELDIIVQMTLDQVREIYDLKNVSTLRDLITAKVHNELQTFDKLQDEIKSLKQTLNSYVEHSKVVDEDVAEIYMDLHNIYSRLEKLDKGKSDHQLAKNLNKRKQQAEAFLKSTKRYINNDDDRREAASMSSTTNTESESNLDETREMLCSMLMPTKQFATAFPKSAKRYNNKNDDRCEAASGSPETKAKMRSDEAAELKRTEKRLFLTNMANKSEFSLQLNSKKTYFKEALTLWKHENSD